jgi:hypothetical protein
MLLHRTPEEQADLVEFLREYSRAQRGTHEPESCPTTAAMVRCATVARMSNGRFAGGAYARLEGLPARIDSP